MAAMHMPILAEEVAVDQEEMQYWLAHTLAELAQMPMQLGLRQQALVIVAAMVAAVRDLFMIITPLYRVALVEAVTDHLLLVRLIQAKLAQRTRAAVVVLVGAEQEMVQRVLVAVA
tara:strand:+ start:113 stop:460 length:348 start_codon:yes stop_codon:yes gene_type:complete